MHRNQLRLLEGDWHRREQHNTIPNNVIALLFRYFYPFFMSDQFVFLRKKRRSFNIRSISSDRDECHIEKCSKISQQFPWKLTLLNVVRNSNVKTRFVWVVLNWNNIFLCSIMVGTSVLILQNPNFNDFKVVYLSFDLFNKKLYSNIHLRCKPFSATLCLFLIIYMWNVLVNENHRQNKRFMGNFGIIFLAKKTN